jgi:hypothetical protein
MRRHVALRSSVRRAVRIYIPIRVVITVLDILSRSKGIPPSSLDSPIGAILVTVVLGVMDTRFRREQLWWSSLGYTTWNIVGLFGAVAITGEICVALVRSLPGSVHVFS